MSKYNNNVCGKKLMFTVLTFNNAQQITTRTEKN